MTKMARQTIWPTKETFTAPTVNNEFDNVVTTFNNHENGSTSFTKISAQDITFPNTLGVWRGFNVKDFGAKGDFTNDDTTAIQAANDAAEAVFGGVVVFPPGTYKISSQLRIKHTVSWYGMGATAEFVDSDYMVNAGSPNQITQGVSIWQSASNKNGLFIQQSTTGAYKIKVQIENILFIGQLTTGGVGPSGTSGDGITVDAGNADFGITCLFKNVNISYYRGYGLKLVEGYYGSHFEKMTCYGNSLTGFVGIGTGQGECTAINLRCFNNGVSGSTEIDKCGLYLSPGGSGWSFTRLSCTGNKSVNAFIGNCGAVVINDFQAESMMTNDSSARSVVFKDCSPILNGGFFSPSATFLGKVIDCRNVDFGILNGLAFFSALDPTAFHIFEDASCSNNMYNYYTISGSLLSSLNTNNSFIGTGSQLYKLGTQTNDSAPAGFIGEVIESKVTALTATATSNQYADITSITLTPGDWKIDCAVQLTRSGATWTTFDFQFGVGTVTGNSGTGLSNGDTALEIAPSSTEFLTFSTYGSSISGIRKSINTSTTYYLKIFAGVYSAGTPKHQGRITATRTR